MYVVRMSIIVTYSLSYRKSNCFNSSIGLGFLETRRSVEEDYDLKKLRSVTLMSSDSDEKFVLRKLPLMFNVMI